MMTFQIENQILKDVLGVIKKIKTDEIPFFFDKDGLKIIFLNEEKTIAVKLQIGKELFMQYDDSNLPLNFVIDISKLLQSLELSSPTLLTKFELPENRNVVKIEIGESRRFELPKIDNKLKIEESQIEPLENIEMNGNISMSPQILMNSLNFAKVMTSYSFENSVEILMKSNKVYLTSKDDSFNEELSIDEIHISDESINEIYGFYNINYLFQLMNTSVDSIKLSFSIDTKNNKRMSILKIEYSKSYFSLNAYVSPMIIDNEDEDEDSENY